MSSRTKYALLLLVVLGIILKYTASIYDPGALVFLAIGMGGMAWLVYLRPTLDSETPKTFSLDLALSTLIFLFAYLLQLDPMLDFVPIDRETGQIAADLRLCYYLHAFTLQIMPLLAGLLWWHCLTSDRSPKGLREVVVVLALVTLVAQRFLTVMMTPYAHIDVFVTNEAACLYLSEGKNPYTQFYPDIYAGYMGYEPGFGYWPGYLYWATPFKYFFNDVRYASATSDVLTSVILMLIGNKLGLLRRTLWLLPLAWLSYPVGMFVLEHAWIDPNLIFFSAALLLCLMYERWILVGLLVGWIAGTKQYGGLVGIMTLVYVASQHREHLKRVALVAAGTFAALLGPFLWLDWRAFYDSTIGVLAKAPLRRDPMSLVALWLNTTGIEPSGTALMLFGLTVNLTSIGGTCWWLFRSRDKSLVHWAGALMLCYFVFFFTGKFAYCNYYYLVSFFVLAYFVLTLGEDLKQARQTAPEHIV
jgi:hypothetical protein